MNFRDRWVTNSEGNKILFTVETQRQLSHEGLPVEPEYIDKLRQGRPQQKARAPQREQQSDRGERKSASSESQIEEPTSIQIDPMTGKYVGRIKWYNGRKGYGFILRGAGEEIFFHRSGAKDSPEEMQEGQWILYDVEETNKGPEATDIEPYEGDVEPLG